jgi:threonine aldolase
LVRLRSRIKTALGIAAVLLVVPGTMAQTVEATTAAGDKVLLHPNGHWEYVDARKAEKAREVAQKYPENQGCPPGTQGGLFGIGRCIKPGDPDYNRGTLNPAKR